MIKFWVLFLLTLWWLLSLSYSVDWLHKITDHAISFHHQQNQVSVWCFVLLLKMFLDQGWERAYRLNHGSCAAGQVRKKSIGKEAHYGELGWTKDEIKSMEDGKRKRKEGEKNLLKREVEHRTKTPHNSQNTSQIGKSRAAATWEWEFGFELLSLEEFQQQPHSEFGRIHPAENPWQNKWKKKKARRRRRRLWEFILNSWFYALFFLINHVWLVERNFLT